jgi:hypothetical protein
MPGCRHVGDHLAGPTGIAYRPGRETWARASGPSRRAPAPAAPSARPGKTAGSRRPLGTAATIAAARGSRCSRGSASAKRYWMTISANHC